MLDLIRRLVKEEEGQGMVEYALIIAGIALVVALAFPTVSGAITGLFSDIAAEL
ncbi:Flp family type IVb pilin [Tissierella creatinini]|nr:Flp family type IVb pilin [Tissierella creatinini]TJX14159.1 Flp family type IVb pilin [Tissierella creatinini]TJX32196.1 Flp family type IVb pilin [Soehngenia saccharolytica]